MRIEKRKNKFVAMLLVLALCMTSMTMGNSNKASANTVWQQNGYSYTTVTTCATVVASGGAYPVTYSAIVTATATAAPTATVPVTTQVPIATTPSAVRPTVVPTYAATTTPVQTSRPVPTATPYTGGDMNGFNVGFNYVGSDTWADQTWGDKSVYVDGDGTYEVSYTATADTNDIYFLILSTDLYKGYLNDGFSLTPTRVKVGSDVYTVNANGGWCFADQMDSNSYRYNIVNPLNGPMSADGVTLAYDSVTSIDGLGTCPVNAGDEITVIFKVSGTNNATGSNTTDSSNTTGDNTSGSNTNTGTDTNTNTNTNTGSTATSTPVPTATPVVSEEPESTVESESTVEPEETETPDSYVDDEYDDSDDEDEEVVTAPKKVTISSCKNVKKKSIITKWKKISGVSGYEISIAKDKKFTKDKMLKRTTSLKYTFSKLAKKKYYVRVRAYKVHNGKKIYGKYSTVKVVTVKK